MLRSLRSPSWRILLWEHTPHSVLALECTVWWAFSLFVFCAFTLRCILLAVSNALVSNEIFKALNDGEKCYAGMLVSTLLCNYVFIRPITKQLPLIGLSSALTFGFRPFSSLIYTHLCLALSNHFILSFTLYYRCVLGCTHA